MKRYCRDECKAKLNSEFDFGGWTNHSESLNAPQQTNGYDCSIFVLENIDWLSHDITPDFTQNDMLHFRNRIALEIIQERLTTHHPMNSQSPVPTSTSQTDVSTDQDVPPTLPLEKFSRCHIICSTLDIGRLTPNGSHT